MIYLKCWNLFKKYIVLKIPFIKGKPDYEQDLYGLAMVALIWVGLLIYGQLFNPIAIHTLNTVK